MIVLLFFQSAPDHPFGGPITSACRVREIDPFAWYEPHVVHDEWRLDWDSTHFILDGVLTPIPAEIIEAREIAMARVRLRVRRDGLLRDQVDPLLSNPVRWAALTDDQQATLEAYRLALLDWPETETDPRTPTPPPAPEFV